MSVIKRLDSVIANKIAAGEVIEKLANVVKELVENSIDALANQIDIELEESGMKSITVIDNGSGMDETDAVLAFERHATSKIASVNDLFRINSLGFRGEALPSIASISKVELTTSTGESGIKVIYEDGKFIQKIPTSANIGTKITVTKLFYTTPARFKYLKSPQYELALIVSLVNKFALAYPGISFRLTNNKKLQFVSFGNNKIVDIIGNIYSKDIARSMMRFSGKTRDYDIHGFTSNPITNRSSSNYMHIFVNQRAISDARINNVIRECYDQLLPKNRFPITVLYIECDPSIIDVNIHPRKQEIKFSEYQKLLDLIKLSISEKVSETSIYQSPDSDYKQVKLSFNDTTETKSNQIETKLESINETKTEYKPQFPEFEYIGQYSGTYLIFQNEEALYLLDQHAAAERIRYERYAKNMKERNNEAQVLLVPLSLDLSQDILIKLNDYIDELHKFGIDGEILDNTFSISKIPSWFFPGYELIYTEEVIMTLISENTLDKNIIIDDLSKSLACKHSLKANHYITKAEAQHLIDDLQKCEKPFTCPHGRPIIVNISIQQIERWFNRVI